MNAWETLLAADKAAEDGYAVAYLVSQDGKAVFVDDMHITTMTSRLVAERGYYPYGLPFGQHQDWTATDRNAIAPGLPGFTGQEGGDIESWEGMFQNFGARYYDSQIGRWHAPDPAWVGFSPYEYCHGNPSGMLDPDGREPITAAIIIGAAIGAYMGGSIANNNWDPTAWNFTGPDAWKTYTGILLGGAVGAVGGAYAGAAMAKAGAFGAMKVKTKYMVTKILGKSAMNPTALCPTGRYKVAKVAQGANSVNKMAAFAAKVKKFGQAFDQFFQDALTKGLVAGTGPGSSLFLPGIPLNLGIDGLGSAISVTKFVSHYYNSGYGDIISEAGYEFGIILKGPDVNYRYVVNNADNNFIMDMRHVLMVGRAGPPFVFPNLAGLGVEVGQLFKDQNSALKLQDIYSNFIGSLFWSYQLLFQPLKDVN